MSDPMLNEQFFERAERLAEAFRARYAVASDAAWTNQQIDQALSDHDLPPLATLPLEPRGRLAEQFPGPLAPGEGPRWQRLNAMHLLGHVMLHRGLRCGGCQDWGPSDAPPA